MHPSADRVVSTMLGEQGFGRARSVMGLANSPEQLVSKASLFTLCVCGRRLVTHGRCRGSRLSPKPPQRVLEYTMQEKVIQESTLETLGEPRSVIHEWSIELGQIN